VKFDRVFTLRVKEATNLVELIGADVVLRRSGKAYIGNCPFHADTKKKLSVRETEKDWKCWSCGAHGDAITWITEKQNLTFPQAVEFLARRAGLSLPQ